MPPSLCESLPYAGCTRKDTGDENCSPPSENLVQWLREPAPKNSTAQIGGCVNETSNAWIVAAVAIDSESILVKHLSSVHCCFIHSLDSSAKRTTANECVHDPRLVPFIACLRVFLSERLTLVCFELKAVVSWVFESLAVLGQERTFSDQVQKHFIDFGLLHEFFYLFFHLLMAHAFEWID